MRNAKANNADELSPPRTMQAFYFDSVDSTNDCAKRLLLESKIHGPAFVVAREQTAGRGQRGRLWLSPRDAGIYLTVVDFPSAAPTTNTTLFTLAAGIACVEALRHFADVEVRLKPINDIYAGDGKLGGILTEAIIESGRIKALLTGIGINVRRTPRLLPKGATDAVSFQDLIPPAQFLSMNPEQIVMDLAQRVCAWNSVVANGDSDRVKQTWKRYSLADADFDNGPS